MEHGAVPDKLPFQVGRVDQVAVVGQSQRTFYVGDYQRLGVLRTGTAGGGVTYMSEAQIARQAFQAVFMENFTDQPGVLATVIIPHRPVRIGGYDAAGFLSPVLQRREPVIDGMGYTAALRIQNTENAAFFFHFIHVARFFLSEPSAD